MERGRAWPCKHTLARECPQDREGRCTQLEGNPPAVRVIDEAEARAILHKLGQLFWLG